MQPTTHGLADNNYVLESQCFELDDIFSVHISL
jgi:hypothetical protein